MKSLPGDGDLWRHGLFAPKFNIRSPVTRLSCRGQGFGGRRLARCYEPRRRDQWMLGHMKRKQGGRRYLLCRARSGLSSSLPEAGRLFLCSGKETEERGGGKTVTINEGPRNSKRRNGIN